MAKLYELTECYNNLQGLLDKPDIPQEEIQKSLEGLQGDITEKFESIAKIIRGKECDIEGFKREENRLKDRRTAAENQIKFLRDYILNSMRALDKQKIKGSVFTLSTNKNPPTVKILNEEAIPKQYYIPQPSKLDKKAILADLKADKAVTGVEMIQGESLNIR